MALARIRQLAAHEVGHTLGFAHNFAASSYGRGSVMDYPAPSVEIRNGKLDLSNAYATGIGTYDKFAVEVRVLAVPHRRRRGGQLEAILEAGVANGMLYVTDSDADRPTLRIRSRTSGTTAATRSPCCARDGGPAASGCRRSASTTSRSARRCPSSSAKLLPLYLHHRYQLQAAVKSLGASTTLTPCGLPADPIRRRWRKWFRQSASVLRSMPCSRRCRSINCGFPNASRPDSARRLRLRRRYRRSIRTPDRSHLRSDRRRRHRRRPRDQRAPPARTRRPPGAAIVA